MTPLAAVPSSPSAQVGCSVVAVVSLAHPVTPVADEHGQQRTGDGGPHSGDPRRLPMISESAIAPPTRVATVSTTRRQVQRWIRTGGSR